ncbi:MAG: alpha/beta fold hydrolase [Streptosporangiales bacterium]|nr:alpha/beta fold hydrolase [Streptosporangiales bacterium]
MVQGVETIYSHPDRVASRFTAVDGYRTHYLEAGAQDAPPLVLVHGSSNFGMGVDRWYPTIIPLSERFHVFAVDEIGFGHTDAPRAAKDLKHTRVRAEHVIGFLETIDVGPVHLVGQSEGGWIATYVSLVRPDLVSRLVLIDSGSTAAPPARHLPYFDDLFEAGTMVPKQEFRTKEQIREYELAFVYDEAALTDEFLDRLVELAKRWSDIHLTRAREFWADTTQAWVEKHEMYTVNGVHISEEIQKLSVPTLVLWGKQSNKGVDRGYELYKKIPGAQFHVFDHANHFLWLDQPRDFNAIVEWFLCKAID